MDEVKIGVISRGEDDESWLRLSGDLTFENIQQAKSQVDTVLKNWEGEKLNIEIAEVTSFDLSFLQLLESLENHLEESRIELNVDWELDDETRLLLEHTGFEKYT